MLACDTWECFSSGTTAISARPWRLITLDQAWWIASAAFRISLKRAVTFRKLHRPTSDLDLALNLRRPRRFIARSRPTAEWCSRTNDAKAAATGDFHFSRLFISRLDQYVPVC